MKWNGRQKPYQRSVPFALNVENIQVILVHLQSFIRRDEFHSGRNSSQKPAARIWALGHLEKNDTMLRSPQRQCHMHWVSCSHNKYCNEGASSMHSVGVFFCFCFCNHSHSQSWWGWLRTTDRRGVEREHLAKRMGECKIGSPTCHLLDQISGWLNKAFRWFWRCSWWKATALHLSVPLKCLRPQGGLVNPGCLCQPHAFWLHRSPMGPEWCP
jgi:hypothetical protein